jgi:multiple sugar transport system substrate-binding protein
MEQAVGAAGASGPIARVRASRAQWSPPPVGCTRRGYLRGTALAAAGAVLAGCGAGGAPSGAPAAGAGGGCATKLEVWAYGIGGDTMTQLIGDFGAKQRACSVTSLDQADDAQGTVQTKLTTALAGGAPPDITGLSPSRFRTWTDAGLITDVDSYAKREKLGSADFPPALWASMSYGGKVRALPFRANPDFVMHWYKPLFQEVGLPVDKGPQTIADVDRMIPMLTRESGGRLLQVGMQPWDFYGTGGNTINAWARAFGGSFYDEAKDQLTFNHPRIIRAVEWYVGWAQRIGADKVTALTNEATNGNASIPFFVSRKWAMHPLTPSALQALKKADPSLTTPDLIGAGPMPFEAPGKLGEVTIGGWGIAAVMGSKQVDAAWEFIKYCGASVDGTLIIARTNGLPGWLKSPGLDEIAKDPLQKPYIDGIRRAEFAQFGYYVPTSPNFAPLDEAIAGKRTARDALEAMQREASVLYDEYKTRFKTKRG